MAAKTGKTTALQRKAMTTFMATKKSNQTQGAQADADAVTMLKNDHREVEKLFESFKSASKSSKQDIAQKICDALTIHMNLEEKIFYPACREHVEEDKVNEAQVEHDSAKGLIAELLDSSASDQFFDAKVEVLSEQIKHHVHEEEKRSEGLFAKAKEAGVDMEQLAARMKSMKERLEEDKDEGGLELPPKRSFRASDTHAEAGARRSGASRRGGRSTQDEDDDDSGSYFEGSMGGERARRYEDEERGYGYSRGRGGMAGRDERGRSMSGGGYGAQSGHGRGGRDENEDRYSSRSERDQGGRYGSREDDRGRYGRGQSGQSSGRDMPTQEDYSRAFSRRSGGRHEAEDDDNGRSSRSQSDNGQGGWFGGSQGNFRSTRRDQERR